jgi:hypothetical protein
VGSVKALALLALSAASCAAPDRWNTSVSRGDGELEGYGHDYDSSDTRLEFGVSGPLAWCEPPRIAPPPQPQPMTVAEPISAPSGGGEQDLPWAEILYIAIGAAGIKGSEIGYRRLRRPKG